MISAAGFFASKVAIGYTRQVGDDPAHTALDPSTFYSATATAGERVATVDGDGVVRHQPIGELVLRSGRLVAWDPGSGATGRPAAFSQPVRPVHTRWSFESWISTMPIRKPPAR